MSQSRQLAAIMFTDIVGYTALMSKDSAKALELVRISKEIQKPLVEKHDGQWLKEMGDGALAKFGTALDAVNCAIDIQKAARAEFDGKLRIGIHSGDITIENKDVYGDGVNIASRLQAIADPGGIYISESIENAIKGQSNVQAKYLGEIRLKNVSYDVRTYAVQGVGLPVPEVKDDKELSGHLWAEIQRRGIVRAILSYLIVSALLVLLWNQWGLELPEWSFTLLITVLGLGLPLSLYLAWNYERSPQGFVRTTSEASWRNPLKGRQRKPLTGTVFLTGLVLIGLLLYLYAGKGNQNPSREAAKQSSTSTSGDMSIAVLPFKDDSPNNENQYFGDGIMDEILSHLHNIEVLEVKSRTAVEPYRNTTKSLFEIAEELNVSFILEGSVRKFGDQFRITTQLISAESGNHMWSEIYDGELSDTIFMIQSNIARKVASALSTVINSQEKKTIQSQSADINWDGNDFVLQAREEQWKFWSVGDRSALIKAEDLIDKALQLDSTFAAGWALKGSIYLDFYGTFDNYYLSNYLDSVLWYCDQALKLDPKTAIAYQVKGMLYHKRGDIEIATINYEHALELSESNSIVSFDTSWRLGYIYIFNKDFDRGISLLTTALQEARGSPMDYRHMLYRLGFAYLILGDFDNAEKYLKQEIVLGGHCYHLTYVSFYQGKFKPVISQIDECCGLVSTSFYCNVLVADAYFQLGDFEKALQYYRKLRSLSRNSQLGNYYREGFALLKLGKKEEGLKLIKQQLVQLEKRELLGRPDSFHYHFAAIYAAFGETETALWHLRNHKKSSIYPIPRASLIPLGFAKFDILFENLWDAAEFQEIISFTNNN